MGSQLGKSDRAFRRQMASAKRTYDARLRFLEMRASAGSPQAGLARDVTQRSWAAWEDLQQAWAATPTTNREVVEDRQSQGEGMDGTSPADAADKRTEDQAFAGGVNAQNRWHWHRRVEKLADKVLDLWHVTAMEHRARASVEGAVGVGPGSLPVVKILIGVVLRIRWWFDRHRAQSSAQFNEAMQLSSYTSALEQWVEEAQGLVRRLRALRDEIEAA